MTRNELKEFCLMWSLDIEDDDHNCLPYTLLPKMLEDAKAKHGTRFSMFMSDITDTTDGWTYIKYFDGSEAFPIKSWDTLFQAWRLYT
jgi:hypothetical protein